MQVQLCTQPEYCGCNSWVPQREGKKKKGKQGDEMISDNYHSSEPNSTEKWL